MGRALSNILCIISIVGIITCACFYVFAMRERSAYGGNLEDMLRLVKGDINMPGLEKPRETYNYIVQEINEVEKKKSYSIYSGIFFILLLAISIAIRGASKPPKASYASGIARAIVIFLAIILIGAGLYNNILEVRTINFYRCSWMTIFTTQCFPEIRTRYQLDKYEAARELEKREFRRQFPEEAKKLEEADFKVNVVKEPKPRTKFKNNP